MYPSQLGLDDALTLSGQWVLQQAVHVGPEHAAAQAGLELGAVVVKQEEVILQRGRRDVALDAGSPCGSGGGGFDGRLHLTANPHPPWTLSPSLTPSQELGSE